MASRKIRSVYAVMLCMAFVLALSAPPAAAGSSQIDWATYVGGSGRDYAHQVAADSLGNAYIVGYTYSSDFPVAGGLSGTLGGTEDGFITKVAPDGSLVWSTYFGSSGTDACLWVGVAADDSVVVAGTSTGSDLPVLNAFQPTFGGVLDLFVAKFSSSGSLAWSSYYGGDDLEIMARAGAALDGSGNVFLAGTTRSTNLNVPGGFETSLNSTGDGFVAKVSPAGTLLWASYLGGTNNDLSIAPAALALGPSGEVAVLDIAQVSGLPTPGGCQTAYGGNSDCYVVKVSSAGGRAWATYLGGTGSEAYSSYPLVAVDSAGNVLVTGATASTDFPTLNAYQTTLRGETDAFLTKLSPSCSLLWSTYLGSSTATEAYTIACDASNNVIIGGWTGGDFPIVNGLPITASGSGEGFATKFTPTGALSWSTILGGSGSDIVWFARTDCAGNVLLTCTARSGDMLVSHDWGDRFTGGAQEDLYILAVTPSCELIWAGYFGGTGRDYPYASAIDSAGHLYIAGKTVSTDLRTPNGFDGTFGGPSGSWASSGDAFAMRISQAPAVSASRTLPEEAIADSDVDVSLGLDVITGIKPASATITETLPYGWTLSTCFPSYTDYNPSTRTITWTFNSIQVHSRTLTYTAHSAAATYGTAEFSGQVQFAGIYVNPQIVPTEGRDSLNVPGPVARDMNGDWQISDGELLVALAVWQAGTLDDRTLLDMADYRSAGGYHYDLASKAYVKGPAGAPITATYTGAQLDWSTYIGGTARDEAYCAATDASGNAYITGVTYSSDFPIQSGIYTTLGGTCDAYLMKVAPDGRLLWSTYFGGSDNDNGEWVGIAPDGDPVIAGNTASNDMPMTVGFQQVYGGSNDIFLAKFSYDGGLVWSTYYGGSGTEIIGQTEAAIDTTGDILVAGATTSSNLSVPNGFDTTLDGTNDTFVAKISPSCQLLWASYFGGTGYDGLNSQWALAVDPAGDLAVAGSTAVDNLPTPGGCQPNCGGIDDFYITRILSSGQRHWATYLGGSTNEYPENDVSLTMDSTGDIILTGITNSTDFPVVNAVQGALAGPADAFVSEFGPVGELIWSTYLGGAGESTSAMAIACDGQGNVVVAGYTDSSSFPVLNAFDSTYGGGGDGFVTKFTPTGQMAWSSYLGGSRTDVPICVKADPFGNVYVAANTSSTNCPILSGWGSSYGGGTQYDAYAAMILGSGQLNWAGYIGGGDREWLSGAALDAGGSFHVVGKSFSCDLLTTNGFDTTFAGPPPTAGGDGFAAKISPAAAIVTRTLPATAPRGAPLVVTLNVNVAEAATPSAIIVRDIVPQAWGVTGATPAYDTYNPSTGVVSWLLTGAQVVDGQISYIVSVPPGATIGSTETFIGDVSFNSAWGDPATAAIHRNVTTVISALTITTLSLWDGSVGNVYTKSVAATGGTLPYTWSIAGGGLPDGLSLDTASGSVSGTPTTSGTAAFTVQVVDSADPIATDTKALSIAIAPQFVLETTSFPSGNVGEPYSAPIVTSGGVRTYILGEIVSGALPPGLRMGAPGIIGTPTSTGVFSFRFQAWDYENPGATVWGDFTIVIGNAVGITTTTLADGQVGSAYSQTLAAVGGTTPYTWSPASGSLPAGLSLNAGSGAISGTPTATGTTSFTVAVADSAAPANTASKALSIRISANLVITTGSLAAGQPGVAYSQTLAATGGLVPYTWSIASGSLPDGVTLDTATGTISGTPTTPGTPLFTVRATDSESPADTATKALSIQISVPGPTYQSAASDAETSTTSTGFIGKVSLTVNPPAADDWIIFGFCEFKCPNVSYATFVQLFVDGAGEGQNTRKPVDPTDYLPFITVKVKNLSAGSHTISLKYRAGDPAAAAYVRNARICAVRRGALEFYNAAYDGARALTISLQDIATLTWTPTVTGNYLVISTAEINASTTVSTDLQTLYNGVLNDEGIMRAADNGDYTTFMSFNYCASAPAGVPITHKISGKKIATDPINHYIRRARILALRLSNGRFNSTAAGSGTEQSTTSTTFQQALSTTWTYGVNGNWLFLNSARVLNTSTSWQTEVRVQLNDGPICGQQLMKPKHSTDLLNYSSIDIRNLTTPRKVDMDWRTTNAAGTAKVRRLRFYGLPLDTP